jgi:hypothetical protein
MVCSMKRASLPNFPRDREVIASNSRPAIKEAGTLKTSPDFLRRIERIYGKDWKRRAPAKNSIVSDRESRDY